MMDHCLSQSESPVKDCRPRSFFVDALHVAVLLSFAIAQPVYDRLGDAALFLTDLEIRPPAVFFLILILSVLLPSLLIGISAVIYRCVPRAYESWFIITLFSCVALLALVGAKSIGWFTGWGTLIAALFIAVAGMWGYFRFRFVRRIVTAASVGMLVFPALLIFRSSVTAWLVPPHAIQVDRWRPIPVVVVVFDEFCGLWLQNNRREIDAERYPHFAELARSSTWFRNASSVHPDTFAAVPAILSGQYPSPTLMPTPGQLPQNLFSILDSTGAYELAVFEPVSRLAPFRRSASREQVPGMFAQLRFLADALGRVFLHDLTPHEFEFALPRVPGAWFGMHSGDLVDSTHRRGVFRYQWSEDRGRQFEHFFRCLDDSTSPTLYFAHVMIPHVPWSYYPSGRRYMREDDEIDLLSIGGHSELINYWGTDDLVVRLSETRYLLQLQHIDSLLGRLLDRLKETGLDKRCLLIVTADHGVCFRPNEPRRNPSDNNLAEIMAVPLFIHRPGQTKGEISDRNVEAVDLFPTIAAEVGIHLKLPTDGVPLFDESRPERLYKTMITHGGPMTVDRDFLARAPLPQARLNFSPGSRRTDEALFHIGPFPELIGRAVADLSLAGESDVQLDLLRYADVWLDDPDAVVPGFFEGYARRPSPTQEQPIVLAVAVNGTIRGVTRTFELDGLRDRWAALLPETAFRPEKNDVEFYAVDHSGANLRISRCNVTPPASAEAPDSSLP